MKRILCILACFILNIIAINCQELPQDYFRNPLDGPIGLSATFAEFRANHFHGGLDMRTGGAIGKPVYAAADGYVARVSISPWGGGKILYIKHPNGYTTLYMHLDSYAGAIGKAVLKEHYDKHSYSISKIFAPNELPVKKGQLVAYSGNTGGSGGPHLHFEIRSGGLEDLHTHSRTYNPLHAGLPYTDNVKPVIRGLRIYPLNGAPFMIGNENTTVVNGPFYLGIYATDAAEGSTLRNGPHRVEVRLDGTIFMVYTTDAFPVDSSRMVNALIDFRHYSNTREAYLLTRALPGAEGEWIPVRQGDGIFRFEPGSTHNIGIKVYDVKDNYTARNITIKCEDNKPGSEDCKTDNSGRPVKYNQPFVASQPSLKIEMAPYTLYADDRMELRQNDAAPYTTSLLTFKPTINDIPPHLAYTLSLQPKADLGVDPCKVVVVRIDGKKTSAYGTTYADGWYSAKVRDFGQFTLTIDTTAPTVLPINFSEGRPKKGDTIKIKIGDNLSGIDTYDCHLNGEWILAEYDAKAATLIINAGNKLKPGSNTLTADVTDACGNATHRKWTITK